MASSWFLFFSYHNDARSKKYLKKVNVGFTAMYIQLESNTARKLLREMQTIF